MSIKPMIGSEEWKQQIIETISIQVKALMSDGKDMRALKLSCVLDDLKIYFKQDKNESEN